MIAENKTRALVVHKPSTLFPQWDEKLASMHEHIEFLNKATDKDFKECPIDEETIVISVVTDIIDARKGGAVGSIEADGGYIFDAMLEYFSGQYLIPDTTEASVVEVIKNHITGLTKHYTEMYTLLIERLSKALKVEGLAIEGENLNLEIREHDDAYVFFNPEPMGRMA